MDNITTIGLARKSTQRGCRFGASTSGAPAVAAFVG